MEDFLAELESVYGVNFVSESESDIENDFEGREFVASFKGYEFRSYRQNGSGVIVYSTENDSGYARASNQVIRDIEKFLMGEVSGLSGKTLEQYW
ncbi:MAG: hypothetical protein ABEJ69_00540 [Candidatus Nanohaloarchaea archaeon]